MTGSTRNPIRKGYADIADGQVHYRERRGRGVGQRAGQGGDPGTGRDVPIVFLHQTALSSRCYEPLMRELAVANRLLALDLPGFGASFRPEGWPSMEQYARWVREALDVLGAGPVWLFGHHTGASVAVEMARQQPDRVRGLMLCGPVCFTRAEGERFRDDFRRPLAPRADGGHLLDNWRYTTANNADLPAEVVHDQAVDMMLAWRARPQAYVAVADHDFERAWRAVQAPTLIVTAPGDYFEDHVARCLALRPGLEVATIGGGNLAPELDPAGAAAVIARFAARAAAP